MILLQLIWIIFISVLIGLLAGFIVTKDTNWFYVIVTTISSIAGALLAEAMLGFLSPQFPAIALIPGVSGSLILTASAFFLIKLCNRNIS